MTQYLEALSGNVTPEMIAVAQSEFLEPEFVRKEIAEGRLVIPANKVHLQKNLQPIGIGIALRTKINANLGHSALGNVSVIMTTCEKTALSSNQRVICLSRHCIPRRRMNRFCVRCSTVS